MTQALAGLEKADITSSLPASILVVEDDTDLGGAMADVLRDDSFNVEVVRNGHEAMDRLRSGFAADLILLDLLMPGMNGWEFRALQRSESDPAIASIPVVVISGYWRDVDRAGLDAVAYLSKPLGLQAIETLRQIANDTKNNPSRRSSVPAANP